MVGIMSRKYNWGGGRIRGRGREQNKCLGERGRLSGRERGQDNFLGE